MWPSRLDNTLLAYPIGHCGVVRVQITFCDFNGAENLINDGHRQQWCELEQVLTTMPLHLKASDQANIQGSPIFDPVGTNQYIAEGLLARDWQAKIMIPQAFSFLGTDVDFGKNGVVVEAQFSNYPFLLNNTLRSELFFRAHTVFHGAPTNLAIIVTKAGMFPSSNSTLYYEQARNQLTALAQYNIFTVPIRLVSLSENVGRVEAIWTRYLAARYSRAVETQELQTFTITAGRADRCSIELE